MHTYTTCKSGGYLPVSGGQLALVMAKVTTTNHCGYIVNIFGYDMGIKGYTKIKFSFFQLFFPYSGAEGAQLNQTTQHTGPVRTIDFNPFQPNLLASGASESEIFIWDLNNPDNPMSPGNKLHPLEDISGVAWNRQVGLLLYLANVLYLAGIP